MTRVSRPIQNDRPSRSQNVLAEAPVRQVAGLELASPPMRIKPVGGVNRETGQAVQGDLMSARLSGGRLVFWLQGTDTNYVLRDGRGALIANRLDAEGRARELIASGAATRLRPLDAKYVTRPPVGTLRELTAYGNAVDAALLKKLTSQNVLQQALGGQGAYEQAHGQVQGILDAATQGEITIATARTRLDALAARNAVDVAPKDVPVDAGTPPRHGATRTTELADPRNRSVGHTLSGRTLLTHLTAQQHYDAALKTWVTDRIVARGVAEYSSQPVTPAQRRSKPDHPQFGYLVGSVGKPVVIKDGERRPITDPDKARARVLEMFEHGGLTPTPNAKAQTRPTPGSVRGLDALKAYSADAVEAIDRSLAGQNPVQRGLGGQAARNRDVVRIQEIGERVRRGELAVDQARKQIDRMLENRGVELPLTKARFEPTPARVIGAGAGGRALPLFPANRSTELPPIRQVSDYLPRMHYALERAAEWAGPEMAAQLRALASPEGAALLMAVAGLNLTPAGPAINTALVALGGIDFARGVVSLVDGVMNGTRVGDLNEAGRGFARGLSGAVINVALGGLMHLTGRKVAGLKGAYENAKAYETVVARMAHPKDWHDVGRLLLFVEDGGEAYRQLPVDVKIAVRQGLVASRGLAKSKTQADAVARALARLDEIDLGGAVTRPSTAGPARGPGPATAGALPGGGYTPGKRPPGGSPPSAPKAARQSAPAPDPAPALAKPPAPASPPPAVPAARTSPVNDPTRLLPGSGRLEPRVAMGTTVDRATVPVVEAADLDRWLRVTRGSDGRVEPQQFILRSPVPRSPDRYTERLVTVTSGDRLNDAEVRQLRASVISGNTHTYNARQNAQIDADLRRAEVVVTVQNLERRPGSPEGIFTVGGAAAQASVRRVAARPGTEETSYVQLVVSGEGFTGRRFDPNTGEIPAEKLTPLPPGAVGLSPDQLTPRLSYSVPGGAEQACGVLITAMEQLGLPPAAFYNTRPGERMPDSRVADMYVSLRPDRLVTFPGLLPDLRVRHYVLERKPDGNWPEGYRPPNPFTGERALWGGDEVVPPPSTYSVPLRPSFQLGPTPPAPDAGRSPGPAPGNGEAPTRPPTPPGQRPVLHAPPNGSSSVVGRSAWIPSVGDPLSFDELTFGDVFKAGDWMKLAGQGVWTAPDLPFHAVRWSSTALFEVGKPLWGMAQNALGTARVWGTSAVSRGIELTTRAIPADIREGAAEWGDRITNVAPAVFDPVRKTLEPAGRLVQRAAQAGINAVEWTWESPVIRLPMNGGKILGSVVYKGTSYLLALEMAVGGGPRVLVYDPVSNRPIEPEAIEAMKMAFVPLEGDTQSVVLQSNLVPDAKILFWKNDVTIRQGLSRFANKPDKDANWFQVISTFQAAALSVGGAVVVGQPNLHVVKSMSLRPFELGGNATSFDFATNGEVKGRSFMSGETGIYGDILSIRVGEFALTPSRTLPHFAPQAQLSVSSMAGLGVTTYRPGSTMNSYAEVLQNNPAAQPGGLWENVHLPTRPSDAIGHRLVEARTALPVIDRGLEVDPATGWMTLTVGDGQDARRLWIAPEVANDAKALGAKRGDGGAVIRVDAPSLRGTVRVDEIPEAMELDLRSVEDVWNLKADTVIQAMQSSGFRKAVSGEAERLGREVGGVSPFDRGFDRLVRRFEDPMVRRLLEVNREFFRP